MNVLPRKDVAAPQAMRGHVVEGCLYCGQGFRRIKPIALVSSSANVAKVAEVFLTPIRLAVFREFNVPVRYIRGWRKYLGEKCKFCRSPATTAAHKIPYKRGILDYGLRPDFLNRWANLVATCHGHNKKAEWKDDKVGRYVAKLRGAK